MSHTVHPSAAITDGTALRADARPPDRRMPGLEGFWLFVLGDLAVFTVLFAAYLFARGDDVAGFTAAQGELDVVLGGVNTVVLLTSSAAVVVALRHLRAGRVAAARGWTLVGLAGGVAFAVLKVLEYVRGWSDGHTPSAHDFFTYYLSLTGLHLGHVVAGCLLLALFAWRWRGLPDRVVPTSGFETVAVYWHVVDLLWLLIFPLIYVAR